MHLLRDPAQGQMLLLFSGLGFYNPSSDRRAGLVTTGTAWAWFLLHILGWQSFISEVPSELPSVLLEVKQRPDLQVLASRMRFQPRCLIWGAGVQGSRLPQVGQFVEGSSETWVGDSLHGASRNMCTFMAHDRKRILQKDPMHIYACVSTRAQTHTHTDESGISGNSYLPLSRAVLSVSIPPRSTPN